MLMKKRLISSILALALTISTGVFSGFKMSEASSKKLSEAPVTLKYLASQDNFDPMKDYTRQLILETINYDIQSEMGIDDDKVNLIMVSGQEYDMIKLWNLNLLGTYINNKVIYPLNDLIDKYGPNLKKAFTKEEWDMVSLDGKIYAIPETDTNDLQDGIGIRQDWLTKLGLKMPTTPEELYTVLKAFKEKDPGGVGSKNVIPFAAIGDNTTLGFNGLTQAFGLGMNINDFVISNGKLISGLELPGAKKYLTYLKKLYKEGLIDADFPVTKAATFSGKLGAGNVGAAAMTAWDSAAQRAIAVKNPKAKFVFLKPLKGQDGKQSIATRGGLKNFLIIPKSSKKAEEVVKYCNAFLDKKNYTKLILGKMYVDYKMVGGKYFPILPSFNRMNKGRFFYPTNEGKMYTPLFGARARKEKEMGDMWDDLNAKGKKFGYVNIIKYAPMLPEIKKYGQQLNILVQEKIMKMLLDENELNNYDAFVKDWKAKGGDELTKAYNSWYQNKK